MSAAEPQASIRNPASKALIVPQMNFERDLTEGTIRYFGEHGIRFDRGRSADVSYLLERYYRARTKLIVRRPRSVHYSTEVQAKLDSLAVTHRAVVAAIRERFEQGGDLAQFLSRKASRADARDGMLSDFGLHHFHLESALDPNGEHVKRSDWLLLAYVQPDDAYFVDVIAHPDSNDTDDCGWSDEGYLHIIDANWPQLLEPHVLRGENGDSLSDVERKELRRKNVNVVTLIGDKAIAPPGGGMTASGATATHVLMAMKLRRQIEHIQEVVDTHWPECRRALEEAGLQVDDDAELRLILVDECNLPVALRRSMSGDFGWSGWAIAHTASGTLIDWSFEWE